MHRSLTKTDCFFIAQSIGTVLTIWDKVARPTKVELSKIQLLHDLKQTFEKAVAGDTITITE